MVTLVGMQAGLADALKELLSLEYDAIEAYEAALNRLDNMDYKSHLKDFKADHDRHVEELTHLLKKHGESFPEGPSMGKQWLTKGKVVLANLIGDKTILEAMKSNEIDTNTAYERINARDDLWPDSAEILQRGLEDERRHKAWLDSNT